MTGPLPPLKPIPIKERVSVIFVEPGEIDVRDGAFVVVDVTDIRTHIRAARGRLERVCAIFGATRPPPGSGGVPTAPISCDDAAALPDRLAFTARTARLLSRRNHCHRGNS